MSPEFEPEEMDPSFAVPISAHHYPFHWYLRARLNEISLIPADAIPGYVGAKVTRTYEPKPAAQPLVRETGRRDADPAGEVIVGGQLIIRPGLGRVLGVR